MKQEQLLQLAWQIVDRLEASGYEAYLVGGYVRDRLLGRAIKDIDIATSALPEAVMSMFRHVVPTGLQHGTCSVILEGVAFEVTTFRSEQGYSDNRRPDEVRFIRDLREDLSRRDFTMNAMAMSRDGELIDPFGGERDLTERILRCVGDPQLRFTEDALRMLRCIRFAAEYALAIEPGTWHALAAHAPRIRHIAVERIRAELERIVEGFAPGRGMELLYAGGLLRELPLAIPQPLLDGVAAIGAGRLAGWEREHDPAIRWASLFIAIGLGAEESGSFMRSLTFPNRKSEAVTRLIAMHQAMETQMTAAVSAIGDASADRFEQLEQPIMRCWKLQTIRHGAATAMNWLKLMQSRETPDDRWSGVLRSSSGWLGEMPITGSDQLAVRGNHLIQAGFRPGPQIGLVLGELLEAVATGQLPNDAQILIKESLRLQSVKRESDD